MFIISSSTDIADKIIFLIKLHFFRFNKNPLNDNVFSIGGLLIFRILFFDDTLKGKSTAWACSGSLRPLKDALVTKLMITFKLTLYFIKLDQAYWAYLLIKLSAFIFCFDICCFCFIEYLDCLC